MKTIVILSYFSIILGSVGMILFATHFPFSTSTKDLKHISERFLGLNGYQLWILSWMLILIGTLIQGVDYWKKP